tara:strand:- start:4714 stop:5544 length:831 start_codon:yes stop_codon:yes gene_type:complete
VNKDLNTILKTPGNFLYFWLENYDSILEKKDKEIFAEYYKNWIPNFNFALREHYTKQMKELLSILSQGKFEILEVGCGCGTESIFMSMLGHNVHGIEINSERLNLADSRKNYMKSVFPDLPINLSFSNSSFFEERFEKKFDIVWLEQAFHHIEPRDEFINKVSNLVKDDGFLIFSEANACNPLIQLLLYKKRGFKTIKLFKDDNGKNHLYGDERIISLNRLFKLFKKKGFLKHSQSYFSVFPSTFLAKNPSLINFDKFFPSFLNRNYNLILKKSSS